MTPSKRKPHRDFAGYFAELRNPYSGGHTIISDCKRAESQGAALVEDYKSEGGRWQVLCNEHGHLIYVTNVPTARQLMKDPTSFCMVCRAISGEASEEWEWLMTSEEVELVHQRRIVYDAQKHA